MDCSIPCVIGHVVPECHTWQSLSGTCCTLTVVLTFLAVAIVLETLDRGWDLDQVSFVLLVVELLNCFLILVPQYLLLYMSKVYMIQVNHL